MPMGSGQILHRPVLAERVTAAEQESTVDVSAAAPPAQANHRQLAVKFSGTIRFPDGAAGQDLKAVDARMARGREGQAPPEPLGSLATLLRTWRERALLTQEQLAARAGVSVGTVRGVEAGRITRPRSHSLRLLADGLGLSVDERTALAAAARTRRQPEGGPENAPESRRAGAETATAQTDNAQTDNAQTTNAQTTNAHIADAQIANAQIADAERAASTAASHHPPRQLPAPPQLFTGRAAELTDLAKIHDASTVVITAIDGMAGVGKTALAVQAAHQMADRYPDGQLFIDLHGYTQGVAPVQPDEALDRMLRALGVPGDRIPAGTDERAGLYRSKLADQRMLIALDNAATEAQVTPLLPGAPGCLVLVTSRRRLAGLDHTHTVSVDTLPTSDAVALLRRSVSDSRLAGQPPDLLDELIELCGRLPLAIRIAAGCAPTPAGSWRIWYSGCATSSTGWSSWKPGSVASPAPSICPIRTSAPTCKARTGCWACIPARRSTHSPRPRCSIAACWKRACCSSNCRRLTSCTNPPPAGTGSMT
jgi:transcriptional regulator with XRE-family HTH domain